MRHVHPRKSSHPSRGFQAASIILSILLAGFTAFAVYELITLNIFPTQITWGLSAILVVLAILIIAMQIWLTRKKGARIPVTILTVVIIAAMGMGGFYVSKATSLFSTVTDLSPASQYVVEIIAMKDSSCNDVEDLKDKKIGILRTVARTYTDDMVNVLNSKNVPFNASEYDGIVDMANALYDHQIEAMILPSAYRGQISDSDDRFRSFYDDTKVVFSAAFETNSTTTTKTVDDINSTPFNVLITGTDSRNGFGEVGRSDVNMIASVNPKTHVVLLTSIPRDYYIETACPAENGCAAGQMDKLTHTGLHGTETTKATIEKLLGIEINYTMQVNFSSVINLVDALGGIDINVAPGYAVPSFYTDSRYGVQEGMNHLNGEQALAYTRERYAYSEGDRQRVKNQQQVLMAVARKALSPSIITSYPSLMDALSGAFQTDLSEEEIKALLQKQIQDNPDWTFLTYSLDGTGETNFCAELGQNAYVMVPDYETVATAKKRIDGVLEGKSPQEIDGSTGSADDVDNQAANRPQADSAASSTADQPQNEPDTDPGYTDAIQEDPGYDAPIDNTPQVTPPVQQPVNPLPDPVPTPPAPDPVVPDLPPAEEPLPVLPEPEA